MCFSTVVHASGRVRTKTSPVHDPVCYNKGWKLELEDAHCYGFGVRTWSAYTG
jgi:hypothetical protein